MNDRRRQPRVSLDVVVDVRARHNFYVGRARDISLGGLFIDGPVGLQPGTELCVVLTLLRHRFSIPCSVAWALDDPDGGQAGIGVEFLELEEHARRTIERFMHQRKPDFFDLMEGQLAVPSRPPRPGHVGPPPLPPVG